MSRVPYANAVGSLMYAMMCTRLDICYAVGLVNRYQSNPGQKQWMAERNFKLHAMLPREERFVIDRLL